MSETNDAVAVVRVQTLGRFAVWRDGVLLPETAWGREKARQLMMYLVTNNGRFLPKEQIVDELWPELPPKKADRDFKVALNALNTALQPERPLRSLSAYIARQGTSYGLDTTAPLQLDVQQFEAGLTSGSQQEKDAPANAIAHYQGALQLYQGDYLPDALYEDWASSERERLALLYLSGATRLARLLLAAGETVEMVLWCQRVLAIDPCWEEAYRLLMQGHMKNGNRPLAIKTYQQCQTVLDRELGIPPMAETTRLFATVIGGR